MITNFIVSSTEHIFSNHHSLKYDFTLNTMLSGQWHSDFRDCTNFYCFRTARTKIAVKKNFKSVGTRFLSQTLLSAATQPCTDFLNDIHYAMTLNTMLSGRRWYTVMSQWFRIIFEGVIPNQVAKGQN